MEVDVSTDNRVRVQVNSHLKGARYCKYSFMFGDLTRGYLRGLLKTPFVTACSEGQIWHSDQSRSDDISPGCMCTT